LTEPVEPLFVVPLLHAETVTIIAAAAAATAAHLW
jgi:hypothetical protein